MNAYTTYDIEIKGSDAACESIRKILKNRITDVEISSGNSTHISQTRACVFEEEIIELAKSLARASAGEASFLMSGYIDTGESAGELKDFEISFEKDKLRASFSDWYIDTSMDSYKNYEDFRESFFECTEEQYEAFKDKEFVYILETDEGEILSDTVPLSEKRMVEY